MKNLKLLNKNYLSIILILSLVALNAHSEDAVDIWSLENTKSLNKNIANEDSKNKTEPQNSIYEMQSEKKDLLTVEEDETLISKEIEIAGLYDPAENGLNMDMWVNSDGDQLLSLFKKNMCYVKKKLYLKGEICLKFFQAQKLNFL